MIPTCLIIAALLVFNDGAPQADAREADATVSVHSPDWPLASFRSEYPSRPVNEDSVRLRIPGQASPCEFVFTGVDGSTLKKRLVLWPNRNHAITLLNRQVCRRIVAAPLGHGDMEGFVFGAFVGTDRVVTQEEFGDRVVWDRRSGREVTRLSGQQSGVTRLPRAITGDAFSACGRYALIQSGSTVRLIRIEDDTVVAVYDLTESADPVADTDVLVDPRTPPFRSLGWAHDSRHFYIQRRDDVTFVGDVDTPANPLRPVDFKGHFSVMAISGDGRFLVVDSDEGHELRLWDVAQSKSVWSLPYAEDRRCRRVCVGVQRRVLFVQFVREEGGAPGESAGAVDQIAEVEFDSGRKTKACDVRNCIDGELFHATENDLLLIVDQNATGKSIDTTRPDLMPLVRFSATDIEYRVYNLSGDGQEILARPFRNGRYGDLSIFSLETMQVKARLESRIAQTRSVSLSPSGDAISILSNGGVLANWGAAKESWIVAADSNMELATLCGVFERGGQRYSVLETNKNKESHALEVRDMADGKVIGAWTLPAVRRKRNNAPAIALSHDGVSGALVTTEGNVKVIEVVSGRQLWELSGLVGTATAVCCDPVRTVVYIGHSTGDIECVEWKGKTSTKINHAHRGTVTVCAVSGDGTVLLTVGEDQRCHVWDARAVRVIHSIDLTFVPDEVALDREGRVAVVADDSHVVILRVPDGKELRAFDNRVLGIDRINLAPDGSKLVCRCRDQSAVIDLVDGEIACWVFPFRNRRDVCVVSDRFGGEGAPETLDACRVRTIRYGMPNVVEDRRVEAKSGLLLGLLAEGE